MTLLIIGFLVLCWFSLTVWNTYSQPIRHGKFIGVSIYIIPPSCTLGISISQESIDFHLLFIVVSLDFEPWEEE